VFKSLCVALVFLFSTLSLQAAPPNPHTFVPNRGIKPSIIMAHYMKENISDGVKKAIYVWNQKYVNPNGQIADLLIVFRVLSEASGLPKQMLENEEFELKNVLNTSSMLSALERFERDTNAAYRTIFEYASLVINSKKGNIDSTYRDLFRKMGQMVDSYNNLAEVTNKQYRKKVLPYYKLNYKD